MVRVGVVGYGYWGPNLVRNFAECARAEVVAVCDRDRARLDLVRRRYPAVRTESDFTALLADATIDAVAIATPIHTHFELALRALAAGKHLLVEKPLAAASEQCEQLIEEAARRNLVL